MESSFILLYYNSTNALNENVPLLLIIIILIMLFLILKVRQFLGDIVSPVPKNFSIFQNLISFD